MKKHILIENASAYEYALNSKEMQGAKRWYTTSPGLLERLQTSGEEIVSLEEWVSQETVNALGLWAKDLCHRMAGLLDSQCLPMPFESRLGDILMPGIRRMLFAFLYKYLVLRHWLDDMAQTNGEGWILGSTKPMTRELLPARLDTLYAVLAVHLPLPPGIRVVETPRPNSTDLAFLMKRTGTSRFERAMLLLNLNPQTAFFKLWKTLFREKTIRFPFRRIRLDVAVADDCELSEETLLFLFLRGCRLRRARLRKMTTQDRPRSEVLDLMGQLESTLRGLLEIGPDGLAVRAEDVDAVSKVICSRIVNGIHQCMIPETDLQDALREFWGLAPNGKAKRVVLSNAFSSPFQRLFFHALRSKRIPVFACEHGVTGGLCVMNEHWVEENHLRYSDFCLCYNRNSELYHLRVLEKTTKALTVGMPDHNKSVGFRKLQRFLARKRLGLKWNQRIVVYISSLYFNNYIYSPGGFSDYWYHSLRKTVVYEVLGKIKDSCILKLYPTFRYAEPDPFLNGMSLPPNVKVVQFIEYRYLRAVGDVVICDSPQSTLGWVWSAGVPLIYLDLPSNPLLPRVAEAFDRAVFRINCLSNGWVEQVRQLLALPHAELMRRWAAKADARLEVEKEYIFGPAGTAGMKVAKCMIEESIKQPCIPL